MFPALVGYPNLFIPHFPSLPMQPTLPKVPITVAFGDGIGPKIMTQTLRVLEAAGAALAPELLGLVFSSSL